MIWRGLVAERDGVYARVGWASDGASAVVVGWHVRRIARMYGEVNGRLRRPATAAAEVVLKDMFVCAKLVPKAE